MKACSCCGGYHKTYGDGFDYLSCMGFLKFGMGKVDITDTTKSGVISTNKVHKTKKEYESMITDKNEGFEGI